MNKALQQIFLGYMFIFFRVHIGIDLLADPIGYLLLYSGCSKLVKAYPEAKKAKFIGLSGVLVSIPSVFVDLSATTLPFSWATYATLLFVLKLVMAYYLFVVMKDLAKAFGNQSLQLRTKNTFKFYIVIHFFAFALISFSINFEELNVLSFISSIGVLVMDISFLLLIAAIQRVSPEQLRVNTFI